MKHWIGKLTERTVVGTPGRNSRPCYALGRSNLSERACRLRYLPTEHCHVGDVSRYRLNPPIYRDNPRISECLNVEKSRDVQLGYQPYTRSIVTVRTYKNTKKVRQELLPIDNGRSISARASCSCTLFCRSYRRRLAHV